MTRGANLGIEPDFSIMYPDVVNTAELFFLQLGKICYDLVHIGRPRRTLTFNECGALVLSGILKVDITGRVIGELLDKGARFSEEETGSSSWVIGRDYNSPGTRFDMNNGLRSPTEELVSGAYLSAFGKYPHHIYREYRYADGSSGFQDAHIDNRALFPTILMSSGFGETRVANEEFEGEIESALDNRGPLGMESYTPITIGPLDVAIFDGRHRLHGGVGGNPEAARRVWALNYTN